MFCVVRHFLNTLIACFSIVIDNLPLLYREMPADALLAYQFRFLRPVPIKRPSNVLSASVLRLSIAKSIIERLRLNDGDEKSNSAPGS